ncbi:MAG: hypothetical protein KDA53_12725 [Hyphomonas sp.]|nr:hypothetical protein [Hyphomonas sp.]
MGKYDRYVTPERKGGKYDKYLPEPAREKVHGRVGSFLKGAEAGEGWGFRDEAEGVDALMGDSLLAQFVNRIVASPLIPGARQGSGIVKAATGLGIEATQPEDSALRQRYEAARNDRRETEQVAREDNPWSFGAGELTGAVASTPVPGLGAGKAAATGTKATATATPNALKAFLASLGRGTGDVLKTVTSGATAGGAFGAVSGAGNAEGELEERIHGAGSGALTGMAWGAGLGPAARYVAAPLIGAVGRAIRKPEQKAMDILLSRMERSGVKLEDARAAFETWAKQGEVPETLAEFLSAQERGLLSALITARTDVRTKAGEVLLGRGKEEVNRLEASFAEALGAKRSDFPKVKADAARARAEDAAPLYNAAHYETINGQSFVKKMPTRSYGALFKLVRKSEEAQRALQKAATYADQMGLPAVRDELRKFHGLIQDGSPASHMTNLSVIASDFLERQVNRKLELANKGALEDVPAGLRTLRDNIREIIDPLGIGEARAMAADRIQRGELLKDGRKFMEKNRDVEDIEAILRGDPELGTPAASPEGQKAFIVGVARGISDELRSVPDMAGFANSARKVARTPAIREKIDAARPKVLTKSGAEHKGRRQTRLNQQLDESIERVADRADFTNTMLGNSKTAFRQNEVAEAAGEQGLSGQLGSLIEDLIIKGPVGAQQGIWHQLGGWANNWINQRGVLYPETSQATAKLLLSTGDEIPGAMAALEGRAADNASRRLLPQWPQNTASRASGLFGGRDGALADEYAQDFEAAYAGDAAKADAILLDTLKTASPEERARILQEYERLMQFMEPEEAALVREELTRATGANVH